MNKSMIEAVRLLNKGQLDALLSHGDSILDRLTPDAISSLVSLTPAQIENLRGLIGDAKDVLMEATVDAVAESIEAVTSEEYKVTKEEKVKIVLLAAVVACSMLALTFKIPVVTVFALALFFPFATELIFVLYDHFIIPEYEANDEIKSGNLAVAVHNGVLRFCILFGLVAGFYAISSYDTTPEGVAVEPSTGYNQPINDPATVIPPVADSSKSQDVSGVGATED